MNGTQAGGDVAVLVDSASVKGFGANVPSCRFGTIYPVAGTSVTGTGEINCVTPAHAAGVVPVSVPPLDLGLTALTFEYISVSTSQSVLSTTYGADPYVVAYLIEPTPMITEVVPWVGWSGSVVTLLGTNFSNWVRRQVQIRICLRRCSGCFYGCGTVRRYFADYV